MPPTTRMKVNEDSRAPAPVDDPVKTKDELNTARSNIKTLEDALLAATNTLKEMNVRDKTRSVELALQFHDTNAAESSTLISTATDIYNYIRS